MDHLVKIKWWFSLRKTRMENRRLCKRYPFLIPWNRWTGDPIPEWNYEWTEWDDMPTGWRKAFGDQMLEELREALIDDGDLYRWRIVQMKEKYGFLHLYDNGYKKGSRVPEIVSKYALLSEQTCIKCGKPATKITTGWISPYCDDCCPKGPADLIEEYFAEENTDG